MPGMLFESPVGLSLAGVPTGTVVFWLTRLQFLNLGLLLQSLYLDTIRCLGKPSINAKYFCDRNALQAIGRSLPVAFHVPSWFLQCRVQVATQFV